MKGGKTMNLYKAVIEFEKVKNQPDLTKQEIAEKARKIFNYDRLVCLICESINDCVFDKKTEKKC
jgi:hypothetical protein